MHRHIATQTEQMQSNYLLAMMKSRSFRMRLCCLR